MDINDSFMVALKHFPWNNLAYNWNIKKRGFKLVLNRQSKPLVDIRACRLYVYVLIKSQFFRLTFLLIREKTISETFFQVSLILLINTCWPVSVSLIYSCFLYLSLAFYYYFFLEKLDQCSGEVMSPHNVISYRGIKAF